MSGAEYLDKIIHWPFCIPSGTEKERLSLLHSWLKSQDSENPPETSGQRSGTIDAESEEKKTDVGTSGQRSGTSDAKSAEQKPDAGTSGQRSGTSDAKSEEKKTDAESETQNRLSGTSGQRSTDDAESEGMETGPGALAGLGSSSSADEGNRAPFAGGRPAAPVLQRQASTSTYGAHTGEEVGELEEMIKAITTTPRKAKRVYNMYVTTVVRNS